MSPHHPAKLLLLLLILPQQQHKEIQEAARAKTVVVIIIIIIRARRKMKIAIVQQRCEAVLYHKSRPQRRARQRVAVRSNRRRPSGGPMSFRRGIAFVDTSGS